MKYELGDIFARTLAYYDPRFGKVRTHTIKQIVASAYGKDGSISSIKGVTNKDLNQFKAARSTRSEDFGKAKIYINGGVPFSEVWSTWDKRGESKLVALYAILLEHEEIFARHEIISEKIYSKMEKLGWEIGSYKKMIGKVLKTRGNYCDDCSKQQREQLNELAHEIAKKQSK